ncbi:related to DAL5-allantoate and ureidosuccinate permease [Phialocephala subalpina]|uniref:Related to DAL5-allantoate and ureidosuccinate permease n=1 Tax=Phialocephala subalpina TaxID=576137 RepID=A0A1L7XWT7_9HELO|nr:related to DAL5-allantoate and ureidosuccinate permease [Phialocephala subalpina]
MANVKPEIDQLESQQNNAANDIEKRLETVKRRCRWLPIISRSSAAGILCGRGETSPLEDRSHCSAYILGYPGTAVHGQDRIELRQFIQLPKSLEPQRPTVQLPLSHDLRRIILWPILLCCLLWGVMVLALTSCRTYQSALAVRFIMGIFEAAVTPGLTLMTGFWYTRREIPLRQCIWYSSLGWGGIVGSYISMGVSKLPANMKPERWELIFFILGGATCLWSFVIFFLLSDSPANSFFLTERERLIAVKRVAGNETGIKNKKFVPKQALVAFKDPKALLLFIQSSQRPSPMGFSTTRTTELKSVGDAVQIIALFIGGAITLNVPNSRLLTATAANILCVVAAGCMAYLPRSNTWGRLVSFWLVNAQSVGFTISLVTVSSNMGGYTHRSMASAMVFTAYCWGNFAGPFVVKASEAPTYHGATIGLLVGYSIKMGCHLAMLAYMFLMNRYRDRTYGPADKDQSEEAGMQDQTEFQNKDFRYVL